MIESKCADLHLMVLPKLRYLIANASALRGQPLDCKFDITLHSCHLYLPIYFVIANYSCHYLGIFILLRNDNEKASLRVGTADLLDMLIADEPDTDFSFALGADTFMDLTTFKWRRSHDVLDLFGGRLIVIYRLLDNESNFCQNDLQERIAKVNADQCRKEEVGSDGNSMNACSGGGSNGPARLLQIPTLTATSSSLVRSTTDEAVLKDLLVPNVLEFIKEKELYAFAED